MRHHRVRPLHVLVLAPVAAMFAGVLGPAPHALTAADKAPTPIVVGVDAGLGGPGDGNNSGAIGVNGIREKDIDLDVAMRLAALLRADLVNVVMTRTTDVYVSDARRRQLSIAQHAALVVSIHANTSSDPLTDGSMVMYPTAASTACARTLDDALSAQITGDGVPDDGFALGGPAWAQSPVPVATIEMAYLSNATEATLCATPRCRQDVAIGVRNGVEAYMPAVIARRNAIIAWRSAHVGSSAGSSASASATLPGTNGFQFQPVIEWLIGLSLVGLVLLYRDGVARFLVVLIALVVRLFGGVMWTRRALIRWRRRRRRSRRPETHTDALPPRGSVRSSVYDDIPM